MRVSTNTRMRTMNATDVALVSAGTSVGPRVVAVDVEARHGLARQGGRSMSWRDAVQSFIHDTADMPIVSRLLASQVVLALGYASLYGVLALRRRTRGTLASNRRARPSLTPSLLRRHPMLAGATAATGLTFGWAAFALISRTRAAPAVTALFTYGHALQHYAPRLPPLTRAA